MKRPRLVIVLLLLTAMVAVMGWRFSGEMSGRKADDFTREACTLFAAGRQAAPSPTAGVALDETAGRLAAIVGRSVLLPRDAGFSFSAATSEKKVGRHAAALRFLFGQEQYLLLVAPGGRVLGASGGTAPFPFPGISFMSGERAGVSFVLWKRDGLFYCLVSDRDLTRVFEIVRRHFQ